MFRRVFSYNFGCRKKALSDFLASSSSLKTVNTRKPAKSFKLKLKDSVFRDAFILVFVNENCCLCKCFTELHFFYWLLVVSYNFNRFAVCFQSFINNACRSTQNAARIKRFLRLHIVIKPLIKNRLNKFFITLKRNSFKISSQIWRLSKVRTGWPYRWFWKFFERFR